MAALGHLPPSISPWNGKICLEEPRKPLYIAEEAFLLVVLGLTPSCYSQPQLLVTWLPTVPAWMEGNAPAHDLAGHFSPQCYCQATVGWSGQAACTTSWVPLLLRQLLLCTHNGELALRPTKTWAGRTFSFWSQELGPWGQKLLPLRGEGSFVLFNSKIPAHPLNTVNQESKAQDRVSMVQHKVSHQPDPAPTSSCESRYSLEIQLPHP